MKVRDTLELRFKCDRLGQTAIDSQYTTYPLRLSNVFRLDPAESACAYLYLINTSPGLLARDCLTLSLKLAENTRVYFTDQAATKIHAMPQAQTQATTKFKITVGARASLELIPEPIILFADAALEQSTQITLDPDAALVYSEIVLPGRLTRGEYYDFRHYRSRLEIYEATGLCLCDATYLEGKGNAWQQSELFAARPVLGNLYLVQPLLELEQLQSKLEAISNDGAITVGSSVLPDARGLLIRVMADKASLVKQYFQQIINCVRSMSDRPHLPYIPK
ncbi:MAG: urease accessory protein UreD [Cyanobacteria bacterium J06623_7]